MKHKRVLSIIITLTIFTLFFSSCTELSEAKTSSNKLLDEAEDSSTSGYYDENPICPWKYQSKLGKGMDVDWSKTKEGKNIIASKRCKTLKMRGLITFVSG